MADFDTHPLSPGYGKRAEFAALAQDEGRRLNEREMDLLDGAMNLLDKALARRADGRVEEADRLVARAADLPYDVHMEGSPGVRGADQLLHDLVTDWFEDSDEDDLWWVEAAVAAHARLTGPGRDSLASVVHGIVLQSTVYATTRTEQRRIRAAFGDAPLEADLGDGPDMIAQDREQIIRSLLAAIEALEEEAAQRTG